MKLFEVLITNWFLALLVPFNNHTLPSTKDDKLEIKHALDRLNTGGHLIILVPAHQKIYSKLDKAVGHYKRYEIDFFKQNKFENSEIVKLHFLDFFSF